MTGLSASGVARARIRRRDKLLLVLVALVALAAPGAAGAQGIAEYAAGGNGPSGIVTGPDGRLWYTLEGEPGFPDNRIGAITTAGAVTTYPANVPAPSDIEVGADGNLWFTAYNALAPTRESNIGRITPAGDVTIFPLPADTGPSDITPGPDGNLYFTRYTPAVLGLPPAGRPGDGAIGKIDLSTNPPTVNPNWVPLSSGPSPAFPANTEPSAITVGADGALYFTASNLVCPGTCGSWVARVTTSGALTPTRLANDIAQPSGIVAVNGENALFFAQNGIRSFGRIGTGGGSAFDVAATRFAPATVVLGPDGNLWFTEYRDDSRESGVARLTTGGVYTQWVERPTGNHPDGITVGPDRALWFTERGVGKIGRIDPSQAPPGAGSQLPPPPPIKPLLPAKKKKACKVPKLRGLSVNKAKKKLRRAKCKYRFVGKGRVVKSNPKAGKRTTKTVVVTTKRARKAKRG